MLWIRTLNLLKVLTIKDQLFGKIAKMIKLIDQCKLKPRISHVHYVNIIHAGTHAHTHTQRFHEQNLSSG